MVVSTGFIIYILYENAIESHHTNYIRFIQFICL